VEADRMIAFVDKAERRSIPHEWFVQNGALIPSSYIRPVDYLKIVDRLYFSKGGTTLDGR
jgi:recombination protein U